MKKIGFLTTNYHPKIGGTETLAKTILESNIDEYEVELITFKNEKRNLFSYPYKIFEFDAHEFEKIDTFFEVKKYDLLVFFSDLHSPYLNLFKKEWCSKYIVVLNLDENTYVYKENFKNATFNLLNSSTVVTFTKEGIANKFLEENNIKNVYIPNFSRDTLLENNNQSIIKKLSLDNNRKKVGYMASYENRKNQMFVLESIAKDNGLKKYDFIFMGNVSDRSYLNSCIKYKLENNLDNVFFIEGTSNENTINQYINDMDCLLLCSLAEGLPLSIIEFMSSGKPWISTPVGGIKGVFKNTKSGRILSKINPDTKELLFLLENALNLSKYDIREEWKESFTKENAIINYKKLFEDLLK